LHGWRAFAGEVGVIVIGVLIALGAQQVAEAIHDRGEANQADAAIRAEVITNITRIRQRGFADECVDARLADIDRIVNSAAPGGAIRQPSWIGRPPRYAIETARWDAASQSGRISLLPQDRQGKFGFLYTTLRYFYEMNNAEQLTWSHLEAISGVDRLTPDGRLAIKSDVAQARFYNSSIRQVSKLILDRAAEQGLHPTKRHDPPFAVCWPITTPAERGRAMIFALPSDRERLAAR
jgi:hypothetical protein